MVAEATFHYFPLNFLFFHKNPLNNESISKEVILLTFLSAWAFFSDLCCVLVLLSSVTAQLSLHEKRMQVFKYLYAKFDQANICLSCSTTLVCLVTPPRTQKRSSSSEIPKCLFHTGEAWRQNDEIRYINKTETFNFICWLKQWIGSAFWAKDQENQK